MITLLLLIYGLQETVVALRGYCTEIQCYSLFLEAKDFNGAQKRCRDVDGDLILFSDLEVQSHLLTDLSGTFWSGNSGASAPNCNSFSVWQGENVTTQTTPCGDELQGFLCQYKNEDPCRAIPGGARTPVTYTAPMGFEVDPAPGYFPRGTLAVAQMTDAPYPDAKYLCFAQDWLQAPWNCEVMNGGCEQSCNSTSGRCACPRGDHLHANLISCIVDSCGRCAHGCHPSTFTCKCSTGYRLAPDGKNCVDVDECEGGDVCMEQGEECVNTLGHFKCTCKDGFALEEGKCVDVSICLECEHIKCIKSNGVYACACGEGFKVSPRDPTKCEMYCDQQDCLANCIPNPELEAKDMHQCFCPEGYVQDIRNKTAYCTDIDECALLMQCEHNCQNTFGGYMCSCNEGYELFDEYMCVHPDEDHRSPMEPMVVAPRPVDVPCYVKVGSVLGIIVFLLLCFVLFYMLTRNLANRCDSFELVSLKGCSRDMEILYLHQHRDTQASSYFITNN
ncbi:thrombomodulin-like [Stigmatopora nigra]